MKHQKADNNETGKDYRCCSFSPPVSSQTGAPSTPTAQLVTNNPQSSPSIALVQKRTIPTPDGPLARWGDGVRPGISIRLEPSLDDSLQTSVVGRIAAHVVGGAERVELGHQLRGSGRGTRLVAVAEERGARAEGCVREYGRLRVESSAQGWGFG